MHDDQKKQLLAQAREHIALVRERIQTALSMNATKAKEMRRDAIREQAGDALASHRLAAHREAKTEDLRQLYPSPYFAKCDFVLNGVEKNMYFGKFSFSEENIYSWITPAAALRFENPGNTSYVRPDGSVQSGLLTSKDQYMIVDGKLLFYTTEGVEQARELIYQEHFTRQKAGFILPEVVEQMEKAQDQVIRAEYRGPFVISGPAGSGKTTLALHRVAYLSESPETADYFQPDTIIVLVQDVGTKEYFSHLLPELGIRGVAIVTFAEWAAQILNTNFSFVTRIGATEREKQLYEYAKLQALRSAVHAPFTKNIFSLLETLYADFFDPAQKLLFKNQKRQKLLDRFDLTILLQRYHATNGEFMIERDYYEESASGTYRKRKSAFPAQYNLMIVDEFQNYLPEQLTLLKSCVNKRLESMVYVGDLAQQTQLGTIRDFADIRETVAPERVVRLQKVYRNTKQILEYIRSRGYAVTIPEQIKEGRAVEEIVVQTVEQEIEEIKKIVGGRSGISIGILSPEKAYLEKHKEQFIENKNIFCMSFQEAQGVEFDVVFIVGMSETYFAISGLPKELAVEITKTKKDLFYVALTRAMAELYCFSY